MLDLAGIGMAVIVGVRREDKNEWERRVPLIPSHLARLQRDHDLEFLVQPSPIRIFKDDEYTAAGATVTEDLAPADIVQWSGALEVGRGAMEDRDKDGFHLRLFHGATPETDTSFFYFL